MDFNFENIPQINKDVERQRSLDSTKAYEAGVNPGAFKVIAAFVSLFGAIIGIIMGFTQAEYRDEFNTGIMLLIWLMSDALAALLFLSAIKLEQILKIKEFLSQMNHVIVSQTPQDVRGVDTKTEWQCSNCGRINSNYIGTCGCGQQRDSNTNDA